MKTTRTFTIMIALASLNILITFGVLQSVEPAKAAADTPSVIPVYNVIQYDPIKPSDTDGPSHNGSDPCPGAGIGCDGDDDQQWGILANNAEHYLSFPETLENEGKLLLFLCGGHGPAEFCKNVYPVAARQGYHVVGLTYPVGFDQCNNNFGCFGDLMEENITGNDVSEESHIYEHRQDSVVSRLINVLEWAVANHGGDGWGRYLTGTPGNHDIDWTQVHLAGFSAGSSHASHMGMLYPSIGRVALFSGPNDGRIHDDGLWHPASYIENVSGLTDTHYFGLVHYLNKSESDSEDILYKVTNDWVEFGMEGPKNRDRFPFIPDENQTPSYFDGAHMLISYHPTTNHIEAHNSVVKDYECATYKDDEEDNHVPPKKKCDQYEDELGLFPLPAKIGYEPAWRCILGTGHSSVSTKPIAIAGASQTVECQGNGGATIELDGSGSFDPDCDVLTYEWTGAFDVKYGRKPSVFLPVGTNVVTLVVKDEWSSSDPQTILITVKDTIPPSLSLTLTPTELWPANHTMIRIDATVTATDSCGGATPQIVLTSITSNQPDNGLGDGDLPGDIQDATIETFDKSFLVRAERAGGDKRGRTYTVTYTATDASGNKTPASATVRVPHTR